MSWCACVRKASSLQLGGVPQEWGGGGNGELECERGGVKKGRVHVRACVVRLKGDRRPSVCEERLCARRARRGWKEVGGFVQPV